MVTGKCGEADLFTHARQKTETATGQGELRHSLSVHLPPARPPTPSVSRTAQKNTTILYSRIEHMNRYGIIPNQV